MRYVIASAELVADHMEWSVDVAIQILALEAMGAIGVNIGAPTYAVVPAFSY